MKKKILISSLSLLRYINECLANAHPLNKNLIQVETIGKEFLINNLSKKGVYFEPCILYGGHKEDAKIFIKYITLFKFRTFLKLIKEQPIVIILDEGDNCIHIAEAIIP